MLVAFLVSETAAFSKVVLGMFKSLTQDVFVYAYVKKPCVVRWLGQILRNHFNRFLSSLSTYFSILHTLPSRRCWAVELFIQQASWACWMIHLIFFLSCLWMSLGSWHLNSLKCKAFEVSVTCTCYQLALHNFAFLHYKWYSWLVAHMLLSYLCGI